MSMKPQAVRTNKADDAAEPFGSAALDVSFVPVTAPSAPATAQVAPSSQPAASAAPATTDGGFCTVSATVAATPTTASSSSSTTIAAATSTVAAASTTSTTTLPAWMKTITNTAIANDIKAADVNGSFTYAGLLKVLTDIDATLASTKTKLSASQLADLKTLAANLNNGVSTSAYLTYAMQAFVNGNAANATWTGGAASSVALGNLAVNATETQFAELVGKWFTGTDLASSKVIMGSTQFSVSYSTSTKALFAASGPSMNDVNQGYLGDCYLLAGLAEVAKQQQSMISSMFTNNGNGTYGVRFYVNGKAEYVTVNSSLANGGSIFNNGGADIWASLAEKAYTELQASGVVTGNSVNYGNSWTTIGNGGAPEMALEEITGASAITDFRAMGGSWGKVVYNASFGVTNYTTGNSSASAMSTIVADLAAGDDVILSSYTNAKDSAGRTTLVASHAMSIYGYDNATGMLQVRNPWGSAAGQYWDTTFEVSIATLLAAGDTITVDNVGQGGKPAATNAVASAGPATSVKLASDVSELAGTASSFVQAIASLNGGGASSAAFTQVQPQQHMLAMPLAA
jgi:hypothetical protein